MDLKIVSAIIASIIGTVSFFPYLRDIFRRKTQPHLYTWLIWAITQGIATAGIWYGGGHLGALALTIGTVFVIAIFLFSLKYGTKNITKSDTVALVAALAAIIVWWQLKSPFLAVMMVSLIDLLGYIPTFRKTFQEPWSETLSSWAGFVVGTIFSVYALSEYNLLTLTYNLATASANLTIVLIILLQRPRIPKPAEPIFAAE